MFSQKKKTKKKESIFFYIFLIFLLSIPFIYKIYCSKYIKEKFSKINIGENLSSNFRKIYKNLFKYTNVHLYIPLLIVYNFLNMYKTFVLLIALQIPLVISEIINLVLIAIGDKFDGIGINEEYIKNESLYIMGYSLILWKIVFNSESNRNRMSTRGIEGQGQQKTSKKIWYIVPFTFIICKYLINFVIFHDLDKIIFDVILGLLDYYLIFNVLKFEIINPRQFQNIIEFDTAFYVIIFIFINLPFIFLVFYVKNKYKQNIDDYIDTINSIIIKYSIISVDIGVILGAKCEYIYYFEKVFNNWAQYNFEYDYELNDEDDESLTSSISWNKKRQWNHTELLQGIIRLIFVFGLSTACLFPTIFYEAPSWVYKLLFKSIVPLTIFGFGLFFLFKIILKYLKVTNTLIFTIFRDSF